MKFLFVIILFFVLIGGIFGFNIGKLLFGSSRRSENYRQNQNRRQENQSSARRTKTTPKLIQKNEGEYVDFEEIKE
jgi:hypothetical protein